MDTSSNSQEPKEAYEFEPKEMHENSWSATNSSSSSLRSVAHASPEQHDTGFVALEPSISQSIPPQAASHMACFDPKLEVKWETNDPEDPKNWPFWKKAHTIFGCTLASFIL